MAYGLKKHTHIMAKATNACLCVMYSIQSGAERARKINLCIDVLFSSVTVIEG